MNAVVCLTLCTLAQPTLSIPWGLREESFRALSPLETQVAKTADFATVMSKDAQALASQLHSLEKSLRGSYAFPRAVAPPVEPGYEMVSTADLQDEDFAPAVYNDLSQEAQNHAGDVEMIPLQGGAGGAPPDAFQGMFHDIFDESHEDHARAEPRRRRKHRRETQASTAPFEDHEETAALDEHDDETIKEQAVLEERSSARRQAPSRKGASKQGFDVPLSSISEEDMNHDDPLLKPFRHGQSLLSVSEATRSDDGNPISPEDFFSPVRGAKLVQSAAVDKAGAVVLGSVTSTTKVAAAAAAPSSLCGGSDQPACSKSNQLITFNYKLGETTGIIIWGLGGLAFMALFAIGIFMCFRRRQAAAGPTPAR